MNTKLILELNTCIGLNRINKKASVNVNLIKHDFSSNKVNKDDDFTPPKIRTEFELVQQYGCVFNGLDFAKCCGISSNRWCCRLGKCKRFVILILWSIVVLLFYYEYDIPGSIQNHLMKQYNIKENKFVYLYSVYSWPNIIMCFFGGFIFDRVLGVKWGLIVFAGIALIGQIFFVVGSFKGDVMMMLSARFIFGIGSESAIVAINSDAAFWFSGKELNIVFAILLNMGRVGSAVVFQTSEPIYAWIHGIYPVNALPYTVLFLGSMSLIACILSFVILFLKPDTESSETKEHENQEDVEVIRFMDFIKFPLQYWLLVIITGVYIGVFYSFLGQSQATFTTKFGVSEATANSYVFFFSFFGAGLSPCLGYAIDIKGRNLYYLILSYITGIIGFTLTAYTFVNPYLGMFFLSVSMAASLACGFGLIPYMIPKHQLGTAYGIIQSSMNLALSVSYVATGAIIERYGFLWMQSFVLLGLIVTAPLVLWMWVLDLRGTGILNMTVKDRNNFLSSLEKSESMDYNKDLKWSNTKTLELRLDEDYLSPVSEITKI